MTYDHTEHENQNPRWEPFLITVGVIIILGLISVANYLMTRQ